MTSSSMVRVRSKSQTSSADVISLEDMNFDASPETLAQQLSVSYDEATHQTSSPWPHPLMRHRTFLLLMVTMTSRLIQKVFCQAERF